MLIAAAQEAVKAAVEAKTAAATSIERHTELLKQVMEDPEVSACKINIKMTLFSPEAFLNPVLCQSATGY